MSLTYIIDGYNLIRHREFRRSNAKVSDEREALLDFIRSKRLTGSPRNKVIVVLDGYPREGPLRHDTDIEVIFARAESADERIKKIIEKSGNAKNIIAVSDDKEIRSFAKVSGSRAMGIEEFADSKKNTRSLKEAPPESELTYTQMHKINQELRKIWLK